MNFLVGLALGVQTIAASFAVVFNLFLLYVINRFTTKNFGFYKYILMGFSAFEIVYGIVVLLGEPILFISQRTLIAFTYYGPISQTEFAILGPTTYCFFYLIWLGFVILHFVYRYITVCRTEIRDFIMNSPAAQVSLWLLALIYIGWSFFCAYFACTANEPHPELLEKVRHHFGADNGTELANYVMRFTDIHGNFALLSTISIIAHYIIIVSSVLTVALCSWGLWVDIRGVKKVGMNISLERQLFKSLLFQTIVPVLFSHIPSLIAMAFPLIDFDVNIFSFFSVFTTVPKALDPIILLMCIKCYRRGVAKLLYGSSKASDISRAANRTNRGSTTVANNNPPQLVVNN